jgi:dihydrolipoamide dehydrogenase
MTESPSPSSAHPAPLTPDVAIIGAGTAGLYALREVRRARKSFVLIDHGPLGTTCARVGCMPSKVALHAGAQWAGALDVARIGGHGAEHLRIHLNETWAALRQQRDGFSGNAARKAREGAGDQLLEGSARFLAPGLLQVSHSSGPHTTTLVRPGAVVIANGSRPVMPAWLEPVRDRAVSTDELFELPSLPARIGVLGLGAIGLEMGLALARLGVQVTGADMAPGVAGITDPALAELAVQRFGKEMILWLGQATQVERTEHGVALVSGQRRTEVDLLLVALGRRPNTDGLDLAAAQLTLTERGMPLFNRHTMQVGSAPVFIAGDANGERPLMHEAVDEGAIAGYNAAACAAGQPATAFHRKVALGIAFSDPDVVSVGARFDELNPEQVRTGVGTGAGNGRARVLHEPDSLLHVYADAGTGRLLGAAMVGVRGEHLAHLLAWAIQRGETAHGLLQLPFYHPVVEEMLQSALQDIAKHTQPDKTIPLGLQRQ